MADRVVLFYRIVRTNPPTIDDMRSYQELGIPLRRTDPESLRRARGISLFDSLERARNQAHRKPWLGNAFIAELAIPLSVLTVIPPPLGESLPAGRFQIEQTASAGHYTLWGDAHAMLGYVRRVERV